MIKRQLKLMLVFCCLSACLGMIRKSPPWVTGKSEATVSDDENTVATPSKKMKKTEQIKPSFSKVPVEIKIRVNIFCNEPIHVYVSAGDYEFDLQVAHTRRRKFRHDIDKTLDASDETKAQPFKGNGRLFVTPEKMEKIFFEMCERFWSSENYHEQKANCLDFVFNFVNTLCDGNAPKKTVKFVKKDGHLNNSDSTSTVQNNREKIRLD
ncbi:hypothetical protein niasHT_027181 [Heterodera trifolii]|uniref:Effector protein n=1 Tax=Heterodera trifolii TaxID=157864 RepID=A0ABD2KNP0_9BILA